MPEANEGPTATAAARSLSPTNLASSRTRLAPSTPDLRGAPSTSRSRSESLSSLSSTSRKREPTFDASGRIIHKPANYGAVTSKVGSKTNLNHTPRGGDKKIETVKLNFKEKATSKVGSRELLHHVPSGGDKKIETVKLSFKEKAAPKVGSKELLHHTPGGGDKKIDTVKLNFKEKAAPKVSSRALPHPAAGHEQRPTSSGPEASAR
ncbi:hypothetical protein CXG81DRAFT_17667 [Caulochytrium protostelioides]|uniref:Microtubule-associated protein n=1 Tax=Caulochytrium protostelioides TaxID=1555241 RepID=A0A4P9XBA8_9FUNG|nr:hypothetical protein CXG81DRAFT_17667 [Caulochytrium protostelioides]|eukprot:RKP02697.1 hypothetical protein CXG81DRAFT_17667 [Caulochytrium protostelioides]